MHTADGMSLWTASPSLCAHFCVCVNNGRYLSGVSRTKGYTAGRSPARGGGQRGWGKRNTQKNEGLKGLLPIAHGRHRCPLMDIKL